MKYLRTFNIRLQAADIRSRVTVILARALIDDCWVYRPGIEEILALSSIIFLSDIYLPNVNLRSQSYNDG
ncbi:MAG: hypothetical protein WCR96_07690 [Candidatus Methanomethylophilaceae archaeon]